MEDEIREYISSGILELYVYGALSESESAEVTRMLKHYPEIKAEVEEIEAALMNLSGATAPQNPDFLLASIKDKLSQKDLRKYPEPKETNWLAITGWAVSIILMVGLFLFYNKNQELEKSLEALQFENEKIEAEIAEARNDVEKSRELLRVFRDRNVLEVQLDGQEIAPEAYAVVYWDKNENTTYIDAMELPPPPEGMVYQVWSLEMDPLTPTSIGLLSEFESDENKIFKLENTNASEGFGITLEPAGGSETPTMERLFTLGIVTT